MNKVIIYKQDDARVAVIIRTQEALNKLGIDFIAMKDGPAGKPYKIITAENLPADRTQRAAWTVDDEDLTDGVGGVL